MLINGFEFQLADLIVETRKDLDGTSSLKSDSQDEDEENSSAGYCSLFRVQVDKVTDDQEQISDQQRQDFESKEIMAEQSTSELGSPNVTKPSRLSSDRLSL